MPTLKPEKASAGASSIASGLRNRCPSALRHGQLLRCLQLLVPDRLHTQRARNDPRHSLCTFLLGDIAVLYFFLGKELKSKDGAQHKNYMPPEVYSQCHYSTQLLNLEQHHKFMPIEACRVGPPPGVMRAQRIGRRQSEKHSKDYNPPPQRSCCFAIMVLGHPANELPCAGKHMSGRHFRQQIYDAAPGGRDGSAIRWILLGSRSTLR